MTHRSSQKIWSQLWGWLWASCFQFMNSISSSEKNGYNIYWARRQNKCDYLHTKHRVVSSLITHVEFKAVQQLWNTWIDFRNEYVLFVDLNVSVYASVHLWVCVSQRWKKIESKRKRETEYRHVKVFLVEKMLSCPWSRWKEGWAAFTSWASTLAPVRFKLPDVHGENQWQKHYFYIHSTL